MGFEDFQVLKLITTVSVFQYVEVAVKSSVSISSTQLHSSALFETRGVCVQSYYLFLSK